MNLSDGIEVSEGPVFSRDEDGNLIVIAEDTSAETGTDPSVDGDASEGGAEETDLDARAHDDEG